MNYYGLEKITSNLEANKMLRYGDSIVVGVSGGADSVCLLFLLCSLKEKYDLKLTVVHVNHGIRKEAGDDEAFVKQLCDFRKVDFVPVHADVPALAKEWGISEEEAGRRVRYDAFAKKATELQKENAEPAKIAVAHNACDNAETVLFHLFRGSGLHGLTGIPDRRYMQYEGKEIEIIRPLHDIDRTEIEKILVENNISWVCDATNASDEYSRNRIRLNILPEAEKVAPGALTHINESAKQLAETESFLRELEDEEYSKCVTALRNCMPVKAEAEIESAESIIINIPALLEIHRVLQKRILLRCLKEVTAGGRDIGSLQVEQLLELSCVQGNRSIDMAQSITAERIYDKIVIFKKRKDTESEEVKSISVSEEIIDLKKAGIDVENLIKELSDQGNSNKYTKCIDYDKIDGQIEVRYRKVGDYITIASGDGYGRKSLKDLMIDCKIPAGLRDRIPVVAVNDHCLWLVGYRISEICKISSDTKKVIWLRATCDEWKSEE